MNFPDKESTSQSITHFFRLMLDKVNDAIITCNTKGDFTYYNKKAEEMLGLPQSDDPLKNWQEFFDLYKKDQKTQIGKFHFPLNRILRGEILRDEVYHAYPKRKPKKIIQIKGELIVENGITQGALIFIKDITDKIDSDNKLHQRSKSLISAYEGLRMAEASLKTTNADLERIVSERTAKLTKINNDLKNEISNRVKAEEKISQKNKELTKINTDLDNFIYTASHDLKAPISNIEGIIDAIKDEQSYNDEGTKMLIDMMCQAVDKFKQTLYDLTEISNAQKSFDDKSELLRFEDIFHDVTLSIDSLLKSSGTNITSNFKPCPSIKFSRKNLRSIFYNLLSNAVKYKSEKSPDIVITTHKENEFCVLQVKDNGLGIPETKRGQIFTMFKRLHDHVEGTGVGLYLVKRIVENAGGRIEVKSEVGMGSTFILYLKIED